MRIGTAEAEYDKLDAFDYVVVNADGKLDQTIETIQAIIMTEHQRVHPRQVTL
jgi:hypothetical protein